MRISSGTLSEAIDWLVCIAYGQPTPAQMHHFDLWLSTSTLNQQAWAEVSALKHRIDLLPASLSRMALNSTQDRPRPGRRKVLGTLALLGGGTTFGLSVLRAMNGWDMTHVVATHATRKGEQQRVVLLDGTQVVLNTNTAIKTAHSQGALTVSLMKGELLIDASRRSKSTTLRALTAHGEVTTQSARFVLRDLGSHTRLSVKADQAYVRPQWGALAMSCRAGSVLCFDSSGRLPTLSSQTEDDAFVHGLVSGQNMKLTDLLAELARYKTGLLDWDKSLDELRVSGSFHVNDVDKTLGFLAQMLPLAIRHVTPYWVHVKKNPST